MQKCLQKFIIKSSGMLWSVWAMAVAADRLTTGAPMILPLKSIAISNLLLRIVEHLLVVFMHKAAG
jgi:hypothetical protein